jgi:hypothetical protein
VTLEEGIPSQKDPTVFGSVIKMLKTTECARMKVCAVVCSYMLTPTVTLDTRLTEESIDSLLLDDAFRYALT